MKTFAWVLAFLVALAAVLTVVVVARQARPWPDCISQVVISKGPDGQPIECICLRGSLSTCFNPGP